MVGHDDRDAIAPGTGIRLPALANGKLQRRRRHYISIVENRCCRRVAAPEHPYCIGLGAAIIIKTAHRVGPVDPRYKPAEMVKEIGQAADGYGLVRHAALAADEETGN